MEKNERDEANGKKREKKHRRTVNYTKMFQVVSCLK